MYKVARTGTLIRVDSYRKLVIRPRIAIPIHLACTGPLSSVLFAVTRRFLDMEFVPHAMLVGEPGENC